MTSRSDSIPVRLAQAGANKKTVPVVDTEGLHVVCSQATSSGPEELLRLLADRRPGELGALFLVFRHEALPYRTKMDPEPDCRRTMTLFAANSLLIGGSGLEDEGRAQLGCESVAYPGGIPPLHGVDRLPTDEKREMKMIASGQTGLS